jgi:ankyrin repeat protein
VGGGADEGVGYVACSTSIERLTSASIGGGSDLRLKAFGAGVAVFVAVGVGGAAWAACPPFPAAHAARESGQAAFTTTGKIKRVPPPARHLPIPSGPLSSVRIVLQRSACLGSCPDYRVEVRGDGTGTFHGESNVMVPGDHSFRIPPETVQCLMEDFRAADFWSLAPKYEAPITDAPYHRVTLGIGGRRKSVVDYVGAWVGMPTAVTDLETAIDVAAANRFVEGDDSTIDVLRSEHFDFKSIAGGALLASAAASGPDELVLDLIAAGAPVHGRPKQDRYSDSAPAVVAAAARGRVRVVRALIAAGAFTGEDANLKNDAYLSAASALDEDTLVEILAANPDMNARGHDGKTALMALQHDDQTEPDQLAIARRLLALGADATLRDRSGDTALYYVTEPELVRLLVKAGASLETRDELGWTPLLAAGTDDAAVALLEAGADPRAAGDSGETVFKTATEHKWGHTLAYLAAHGVTR